MARQDKEAKARPGPRPRGPFADKRKTLTTRITEKTRLQLEEAAAETGRSLSQEIELRLERSFEQEDAKVDEFGGLLQYLFCRNFASLAQAIAAEIGTAKINTPARTWINDSGIFYAALGLWETVMDEWFIQKGDDPTKEWAGALAEGPRKEVYREIGKNWDKVHKSLLLPQQDNSDAEEA